MSDASNSDLAQNAGFGSGNQTTPSAVDVERQPQPASAPETDSTVSPKPPLPLGPAARQRKRRWKASRGRTPPIIAATCRRRSPPIATEQE